MADITDIPELEEAMGRKEIRWAASVYQSNEKALRTTSSRIFGQALGEGTILK